MIIAVSLLRDTPHNRPRSNHIYVEEKLNFDFILLGLLI